MDQVVSSNAGDRSAPAGDNQRAASFDAHALLSDKNLTSPDNKQSADTAAAYLPDFDLSDFKENAQRVLTPVKVDSDGNYSGSDLVKMVADPSLKGHDAVVASTIYQMYQANWGCASGGSSSHGGHSRNGSGDSGSSGGGSSGEGGHKQTHKQTHKPAHNEESAVDQVSAVSCSRSLNKSEFEQLAKPDGDEAKVLPEFGAMIELDQFNQIDTNHDLTLSAKELAANPRFGHLASDIPALGKALQENPGGVDYSSLHSMYAEKASVINTYATVQGALDFAGKSHAASSSSELFADHENPLNSIKMEDVVQGVTGDCYFQSVLAAVAKNKPEIIRDSIKDNQDGSYTVTFKGDAGHPVTVKAPTETEMALYSQGSKDGTWAPVMEKAFAKYSVDVLKRPVRDGTEQDATSAGIERPTMHLLTGEKAESYPTAAAYTTFGGKVPAEGAESVNDKSVNEAISGLQEGKLLTLGVARGVDAKLGLSSQHAYTIVSYTPGADGGSFELRNPIGPNSSGGSRSTITAEQLKSNPVVVSVGDTGL